MIIKNNRNISIVVMQNHKEEDQDEKLAYSRTKERQVEAFVGGKDRQHDSEI